MVWLINGLVCKILNFVPRHTEIVAEILGDEYSRTLTILIGILEVIMALWVISKFKSRLNAIIQITAVMAMNVLEFILVPNLLLWGKFNFLFALLFVFIIYLNEFKLNKKIESI
nr:DoxX-like family protein [Mesonia sp.]